MPSVVEHLPFDLAVGDPVLQSFMHIPRFFFIARFAAYKIQSVPCDRQILFIKLSAVRIRLSANTVEVLFLFEMKAFSIGKQDLFHALPYTGRFLLYLITGNKRLVALSAHLDIRLKTVFGQTDRLAEGVHLNSQFFLSIIFCLPVFRFESLIRLIMIQPVEAFDGPFDQHIMNMAHDTEPFVELFLLRMICFEFQGKGVHKIPPWGMWKYVVVYYSHYPTKRG